MGDENCVGGGVRGQAPPHSPHLLSKDSQLTISVFFWGGGIRVISGIKRRRRMRGMKLNAVGEGAQ